MRVQRPQRRRWRAQGSLWPPSTELLPVLLTVRAYVESVNVFTKFKKRLKKKKEEEEKKKKKKKKKGAAEVAVGFDVCT